jgi:hypothetical protein
VIRDYMRNNKDVDLASATRAVDALIGAKEKV